MNQVRGDENRRVALGVIKLLVVVSLEDGSPFLKVVFLISLYYNNEDHTLQWLLVGSFSRM